MAARSSRLIVWLIAAVVVVATAWGASRLLPGDGRAGSANSAQRIVSLVPAVTEMLFTIGAGGQVVGVSSFDKFPPEVEGLPRVGALLDPDTERILALRPDLVVTYGSQAELQTRFERAGIRTFSYRHGGVEEVLATIRDLGEATGRASEADDLAGDVSARLEDVQRRVAGRERPRVLLVFGRQRGTLREVYASGGEGFLHEMLEIAGGENVFADAARESVQPSTETILARAPDVILEIYATGLGDGGPEKEIAAWSTLASLPAVRDRRIYFLEGDYLVVPGPRIGAATEAMARILHPAAF